MSGSDIELQRKLEAALANLPWIQREIFVLRRIEGLTYGEIGWLMGLSERYIERQMASAICKLAKQMDGETLHWWERLF